MAHIEYYTLKLYQVRLQVDQVKSDFMQSTSQIIEEI